MEDHGVQAGYYDNLRREVVLECLCGFLARGDTWEEASAELDEHLEDSDG